MNIMFISSGILAAIHIRLYFLLSHPCQMCKPAADKRQGTWVSPNLKSSCKLMRAGICKKSRKIHLIMISYDFEGLMKEERQARPKVIFLNLTRPAHSSKLLSQRLYHKIIIHTLYTNTHRFKHHAHTHTHT